MSGLPQAPEPAPARFAAAVQATLAPDSADAAEKWYGQHVVQWSGAITYTSIHDAASDNSAVLVTCVHNASVHFSH